MPTEISYKYTLLRYEHDVRTEEFINVGVLFWVPELKKSELRVIDNGTRVKSVFPGSDFEDLKFCFRQMSRVVKAINYQALDSEDVMTVAHSILPKDDSSLKWSKASIGRSVDLEKTINRTFSEYVLKYETHRTAKVRTDRELWGHIESKLQERSVHATFKETSLRSPLKEYHFDHSWQNGCPHIIAPISLDSTTGDKMAEKATRWGGNISDLMRTSQNFCLHLVLGEPQKQKLTASYGEVVAYLKDSTKADPRMDVIEEAESDSFVDEFAEKIRSHEG